METGRDARGIRSLNRHTLEQIVGLSPAAILVADALDPRLPIVYANGAYERLSGYSADELCGHPWAVLARAADGDGSLAALRAAIGRGEACRATLPDLKKDGTSWTSEVSVAPLSGPRGDLRFFLLTHEPVTAVAASRDTAAPPFAPVDSSGEISLLQRELGRARQKIATMDRLDPATGLVRFAHFQETLRRDLAMARRDRRFVTLLVFEIVEYAAYRQTFGDKAADSCQRMIGAQIMSALRRAGDLCARYDESTLVAAAVGQHADEIRPLVDRIADGVRQLKLHNPRGKTSRYITTRVSLISCPPGAHDDPEPLIARALTEARSNEVPVRAILG
ncbi:MAG TPA: diguanylate cyclase [Gammaproteobacteria bacterium]|nr:diguanylate cyclase [Gammaproteobacteria bacterium]